MDRAIDGIKDSDLTYAYQLLPLKRVKEEVAKYHQIIQDCSTGEDDIGSITLSSNQILRPSSSSPSSLSTLMLLDGAAKAELDKDNEWENKILKFVVKPTAVCHMLNERKSNHNERIDFYGNLIKFIQKCRACPDATSNAPTATSTTPDGSIVDGDSIMASPSVATKRLSSYTTSSSSSQMTLEEVSYSSTQFKGVHAPRDLAILEYCVSKYLARITKLHRMATIRTTIAKEYKMAVSAITEDIITKNENGLVVQLRIRKREDSSSSYNNYGKYKSYSSSRDNFSWNVVGDVPILVRISPTLTVSGLRRLLGQRLLLLHSSCFSSSKVKSEVDHPSNGGGSRSHYPAVEENGSHTNQAGGADECYPELLRSVIQQVAFSWEGDSSHGSGGRVSWSGNANNNDSMEFGSVSLDHFSSTHSMKASGGDGGGNTNGYRDDDTKEMELVASIVKNRSTILVSWPPHFNDILVDYESALCGKEEYLTKQQKKEMEEEDGEGGDDNDNTLSSTSNSNGSTKKRKKKGVSIMDCIHKYCEMEQLDSSDMWYCNQCKEHVRAWKQFHIHRTPPILIVHLKRFHYSSTTHRRDKIDTLIDFPLNDLDLRSVVTKHNTDDSHHWEVGQEPIYDCYAVSNHFGGLGGGHYTAYARWVGGGDRGRGRRGCEKSDGNNEEEIDGGSSSSSSSSSPWYTFDDSRVTTCVDESEVVSSAAYCLYYKRKDVVVFDGDDDDHNEVEVENDNATKPMMMSPTTTTTIPGRNHHVVDSNDDEASSSLSQLPPPLPPPHYSSFHDANHADSAPMEVESGSRSISSSTTASYVTPAASLNDDNDDYEMNEIII